MSISQDVIFDELNFAALASPMLSPTTEDVTLGFASSTISSLSCTTFGSLINFSIPLNTLNNAPQLASFNQSHTVDTTKFETSLRQHFSSHHHFNILSP